MKLKKLNMALMAAGLVAGSAITAPVQAVMNSDDGTGEVLIYPFYTVQGPTTAVRTSLFTVVNHSSTEIKAVKVRFHEAHNSRDALDFNLYLSPNDVWTGAVARDPANGVATLVTDDKSCTIPNSIMVNTNTFSTLAYTQTSNNDGGNQNALRTNEGYVEVIEMGVVAQNGRLVTTGDGAGGVDDGPLTSNPEIDSFGEAIIHDTASGYPGGALAADGIPVGCKALEQAATNAAGVWKVPLVAGGDLDNAHTSVSQPTGNLSGTGLIVQANLGTVAGYNAKALKHFYDVSPDTANCNAGAAGVGATFDVHHDGTTFCETNAQAYAATTTNRAFDDLHSFKDLDVTTANARSVQTYPNLAMAYPQVSTHFTPNSVGGALTVLEWSDNELVSSGITDSATPVYFAAVKDLDLTLANDTPANVSDAAANDNCGGLDGVQSLTGADTGVCGNARPVSAVLASSALKNEFVLEQDAASGIDFRTDVVVSFPTKWYFTDNGVYDSATDTVLDGVGGTAITALQGGGANDHGFNLLPFTSQFVSKGDFRDQACEKFYIDGTNGVGGVGSGVWDREEKAPSAPSGVLVPSPAITTDPVNNYFCHESNVITLNDGDLMSSRIANGLNATVENAADGTNSFNINITDGILSGWFQLAFDTPNTMTSIAGGPMDTAGPLNTVIGAATAVNGLPGVGFVVEGLVSGADNFDGNFTTAIEHKSVK